MHRSTKSSRRQFLARAIGGGAALLALPCVAQQPQLQTQPWVDQQQFGRFVVRADFALAAEATLLQELPALETELRRVLGVYPSSSMVVIHLLNDRQQYADMLARDFAGLPYRRALYVERGNTSQIFTYRSEQLAVDLRHESTHAVLHAGVQGLPLWLDEGLAEYFEETESRRAAGHEHLKAVRWNARLGSIAPVKELERRQQLSDMTALDYRHAWAWVHFLLHGPAAGHAVLVRYLDDLASKNAATDFADRLEAAVPDSYRLMTEHFVRWQPLAS